MSDLATRPPLSVRVTDRLSVALAGKSLSRRRFLFRLAVVASALAVHPLRYVLRPTSAYASVCGDGNTCASGWSVFCCTINDGANTCPDGSYVAGWWKVDGSAFCNGSARYYVDCNREPGASCECRCNDTGCDRRRTCCNNFRYGQCNTHISGVTEVVCRIVVCAPPWEWDPACGRTSLTAPSTRTHSASCLPGENPTAIAVAYQDMGMTGSPLGRPVSAEVDAAAGGRKREYEHGLLLWRPDLGVLAVMAAFRDRYQAHGAENGPLGHPTGPSVRLGDRGHLQPFERGVISGVTAERVYAVFGPLYERYQAEGGRDAWGLPLSDPQEVGNGTVTQFERGEAYRTPPGDIRWLEGAILTRYRDEGGPAGHLGYPTSDIHTTLTGRRRAQFTRGAIELDGDRTEVVIVRRGRPARELPPVRLGGDPRAGRDPGELP